jgi:hypothetical protein
MFFTSLPEDVCWSEQNIMLLIAVHINFLFFSVLLSHHLTNATWDGLLSELHASLRSLFSGNPTLSCSLKRMLEFSPSIKLFLFSYALSL